MTESYKAEKAGRYVCGNCMIEFHVSQTGRVRMTHRCRDCNRRFRYRGGPHGNYVINGSPYQVRVT